MSGGILGVISDNSHMDNDENLTTEWHFEISIVEKKHKIFRRIIKVVHSYCDYNRLVCIKDMRHFFFKFA